MVLCRDAVATGRSGRDVESICPDPDPRCMAEVVGRWTDSACSRPPTDPGDSFQTIVDVQATEEQAEELGALVLAWMIGSGIVEPACRGGWVGEGHAPGPRYTAAVVQPDSRLHRLWDNGLEVVTGRTVFHSVDVDAITCPHCQMTAARELLKPAIQEWVAGAAGTRRCGGCGRLMGLNDWCWQPPWGFGYLGLQFWNWPPLTKRFVAEVGRRLGHRTVLAAGTL